MTRRLRIAVFVLIVALALWLDPIWAVAPVALFKPVFGPSCTIFSDGFSTDQTGTAYTKSGTMSVSGGVLTMTSASATLITNSTTSGTATGAHASVTITLGSTSDKARLYLAYTDSTHYWVAEAQAGATNGTLKIFENAGSGETQRGSTATALGLAAGVSKSLCFSIGNGIVVASCAGATEYVTAPTVASTSAGLGTGSGSSSVTFDNFSFNKHRADDSACSACTYCTCCPGSLPGQVMVTISGIVGSSDPGGCPCTDDECSAVNGTYVLDLDPSVGPCVYSYHTSDPTKCGSLFDVVVRLDSSSATLSVSPSFTGAVTVACPRDCLGTLSGSMSGNPLSCCGHPCCDASGGSFTITPL